MGPVQGQVWVKCGPQLGSSVQEYSGSIVGRLQGRVRVGIGVGWCRIWVHNPGRDGVGGRSGTGRQQRETRMNLGSVYETDSEPVNAYTPR